MRSRSAGRSSRSDADRVLRVYLPTCDPTISSNGSRPSRNTFARTRTGPGSRSASIATGFLRKSVRSAGTGSNPTRHFARGAWRRVGRVDAKREDRGARGDRSPSPAGRRVARQKNLLPRLLDRSMFVLYGNAELSVPMKPFLAPGRRFEAVHRVSLAAAGGGMVGLPVRAGNQRK